MPNSADMGLGGTFTSDRISCTLVRLFSRLRISDRIARLGSSSSRFPSDNRMADAADNNEDGIMNPGDCFTIEPSLVQGSNSRGSMWEDGWTMATEVCEHCTMTVRPVLSRQS
jgi:hypothetical protein